MNAARDCTIVNRAMEEAAPVEVPLPPLFEAAAADAELVAVEDASI